MLKRKIKIILIGLSSLLFVGLVYGLFSAKPEIIVDESLRIEEPELPSIQSQIERADKIQSSTTSDSQIESSLENQLIDQPVASFREEIVSLSNQMLSKDSLDQQPSRLAETKIVEEDEEQITELSAVPVTEAADAQSERIERMAAQSVSPFRDDSVIQGSDENLKVGASDDDFLSFDDAATPESLEYTESASYPPFETSNDVEIIPDVFDFLDLNLPEVRSTQQKMVLVEGDQLIVDDINQDLEKYEPVIIKSSAAPSAQGKVDVELLSTEAPGKNKQKPSVKSTLVTKRPETKPSVFTLPEVDQKLMQGDNEVSKKYRQTMAKLISINAKLRDADEENVELHAQFEMAVSQNRMLAQIIRDIDTQIKAFTLTN